MGVKRRKLVGRGAAWRPDGMVRWISLNAPAAALFLPARCARVATAAHLPRHDSTPQEPVKMKSLRVFLATLLCLVTARQAIGDALERIGLEKLRATHERIEALKSERRKVSLESGYDDVRSLLHVHSAFSHDSRGKIEDIVAAAKQAGVRVIMFTEHPAEPLRLFQRWAPRQEGWSAADSRRRNRWLLGLSQAEYPGREDGRSSGFCRSGARDRRADLSVPSGRADGLGDQGADRQRNLQHPRRLQRRAASSWPRCVLR